MKTVSSFFTRWFKIKEHRVCLIANVDDFSFPFVRVFFHEKVCDLGITHNQELLEGDLFECEAVKIFIKQNEKVLLQYWERKIDSATLCGSLVGLNDGFKKDIKDEDIKNLITWAKRSDIEGKNWWDGIIDGIPTDIDELLNTQEIMIRGGSVKYIPHEISVLVNVHYLDICKTDIKYIPKELFALPSLQKLVISQNRYLTYIKDEIVRMNTNDKLVINFEEF